MCTLVMILVTNMNLVKNSGLTLKFYKGRNNFTTNEQVSFLKKFLLWEMFLKAPNYTTPMYFYQNFMCKLGVFKQIIAKKGKIDTIVSTS